MSPTWSTDPVDRKVDPIGAAHTAMVLNAGPGGITRAECEAKLNRQVAIGMFGRQWTPAEIKQAMDRTDHGAPSQERLTARMRGAGGFDYPGAQWVDDKHWGGDGKVVTPSA